MVLFFMLLGYQRLRCSHEQFSFTRRAGFDQV
jgi:hypothetical protein